MVDFVVLVLRNIAFWLDQIVYGFISIIYNLLYEITNTNIFSIEIFKQFSSKVYALVGIFMLFKVSISIFSYIVDPDAFLDKSKGFNKIISNVVITFAMLIFVPFVFKMGSDLQNIVLKSNFLGRLFMLDDFSSANVLNPGDSMAYETLTAFYHFDTLTYPLCEGNPSKWSEECKTSLENIGVEGNEYDNLKKYLGYGYELKNVNLYMNWNVMHVTDDNDNYVMSYLPIISTIAGGAIVLLLMVFCFDVAVRNVKMGFLQMIAPIPIISRIDPKTGKGVFDKWVKTTISTYMDLFIRLLAINFAIFVISLVTKEFTDGVSEMSNASLMAKVFIFLGILLFAKEIPKLIKDITGYDAKGSFTMNPLKKLNDTGIAPMAGAGLLSFGANIQNGYKNFDKTKPKVKQIAKILGSGVAGFSSASTHVLMDGIKNKGDFKSGTMTSSVQFSSNNRRNRESGYKIKDKIKDKWTDMSAIKYKTGTTSLMKDQLHQAEREAENARQNEEALRKSFTNNLAQQADSGYLLEYFQSVATKDSQGKAIRDANGNIVYETKSVPGFENFLQNLGLTQAQANAVSSRYNITAYANQLASIERLDNKTQKCDKQVNDIKEQIQNQKGKNKGE